MKVFWSVVAVLAILGALRIAANEIAYSKPPLSCQVLGGNWTIWSGWRCG